MKYVFGGGLSGLIWAYYNPEYTVVTDSFGGFVDTKFGRAFVVLHETPEMVELFDELGIDSFVKELKIAYYDIYDRSLRRSARDNFARRYVEEKLPTEFQPGKDLELSAPGDSWRALFVDSSIVDALRNEIENVKTGRVQDIDEDTFTFENSDGVSEFVSWDRIVSTLPAPVFQKIVTNPESNDWVDLGWELDNRPTTYAELNSVPDEYREMAWDILYTVDRRVPYHRVVRNMLSSSYFVECLGDYSDEVDEWNFQDLIVNPFGVIDDEELDPPFDGISFLGRYSEWQHDVRIDHVISRAREGEA